MKPLLLGLFFLVASGFSGTKKAEITPEDRKFALDYFMKTKQRLLQDVENLSKEQLNYTPDATHWSVAQCVEHIALAENGIWQWCMLTLKNDSAKLLKPEKLPSNEELIAMITNRTQKAQAPEMLKPGNKFPGTKEALAAFVSRRDSAIQYLKTVQDPLRDYYMKTPLGTIDVFQGLLFLAAHSERHTLQIEELLKSPGFPKK